jgi:hypothetical protein
MDAVYVRDVPVLLVILTFRAVGTACPIWNGKVSEVTLAEMTGSLVTFSTTLNCWEALPGVAEVTVTVAE